MLKLPAAVLLFALASAPLTSQAHITLISPFPETSDQKYGPCGAASGNVDGTVSVYSPGQTITVRLDEFINHPGHFRISFDSDGHDDFVDPAAYDDFYTNDTVLLDNIPDAPAGGIVDIEVTLPNIKCTNCTLQVVQVMTDKAPYGDGDDLYYQCADIALAGPSVAPDAGPESVAELAPDTGAEAAPDVAPDTAPDMAPDTSGDIAADAGPTDVASNPPAPADEGCTATAATPAGSTPVAPLLLLVVMLLSALSVARRMPGRPDPS